MREIYRLFFFWGVTFSIAFVPFPVFAANSLTITEMRSVVTDASMPNPPWTGPTTGPVAQKGKRIALIADDLRNGGILGVAQGVAEAAKLLDWQLKIFDVRGTEQGRNETFGKIISGNFDGVILVGADAESLHPQLMHLEQHHIPIVGWHVGAKAGVMTNSPVAVNVSTDPLKVAQVTAMAAVIQSSSKAGVIIFTDSNYKIATAKAEAMAGIIRACTTCNLLAVKDIAISKSNDLMGDTTRELLAKYGSEWTYALAINDIYFDYMMPELIKAGTKAANLKLLSAGDGSAAAFQRIITHSFQVGTVAEPLNLHGWQLADELNRLLAGQPVNGYIFPVHLVTPDNVYLDGGLKFAFDPQNGYRQIYQGIWAP